MWISVWKNVTLCGCGLVVVGLGALGLNRVFPELVGDNYTLFFSTIGIGLVCLIVGGLGLATKVEKHVRRKIGICMLLPLLFMFAIAVFADPNVHGIYPLFFLATVPSRC